MSVVCSARMTLTPAQHNHPHRELAKKWERREKGEDQGYPGKFGLSRPEIPRCNPTTVAPLVSGACVWFVIGARFSVGHISSKWPSRCLVAERLKSSRATGREGENPSSSYSSSNAIEDFFIFSFCCCLFCCQVFV